MLTRKLISSGGERDPLFPSVMLLCRFDGTPGVVTASQIRDDSRHRRTAASVGAGTALDGAGYFGQALVIPTSGDVVTFADDANLQFGTGDFTIEVIARRGALSGTQSILAKGVHNSTGWELRFNALTVEFRYGASSSFSPTLGTTPYLSDTDGDVWYFIQVTRNGTSMSIFLYHLTGSRAGSNSIGSATVSTNFNQTSVLYIGANRQGGTPMPSTGLIDEIRLTADNRSTAIPVRPFPGK
jgi:hypothetical protein